MTYPHPMDDKTGFEAPEQWHDCPDCNGTGTQVYRVTVYEHGCGFPHDDSDERPCGLCGGTGGWVCNVEVD